MGYQDLPARLWRELGIPLQVCRRWTSSGPAQWTRPARPRVTDQHNNFALVNGYLKDNKQIFSLDNSSIY